MLGTAWMKAARRIRTENRDMPRQGWERVGEGGGKLWEIERGPRIGQTIRDVKIAADGRSLWVKVA